METRNTPEVIEHFFESLKNPTRTLTEWEENFVTSVEYQYNQKRTLTDKQFKVLERIYAEKTE